MLSENVKLRRHTGAKLRASYAPTAVEAEQEGARGVRLVALWKGIKGVIALSLGLVLAVLTLLGYDRSVHDAALTLRHHCTSAWSVRAADLLLASATQHGMKLTALALVLDGLFCGVAAWSLHRERWWGPWLVVVATSCLLPIEAYHFLRHVSAGRLGLFLVNLAVVIYLARHALRARARRAEAADRERPSARLEVAASAKR